MAKIQTIKNKDNVTVYPQTHTQAVYDANGKKLQDWMNEYFTAEDPSAIEDVNTQFEIQGNKTTVLNSDSTNIQYPGARAVYDLVTKSIGEVAGQLKIEVTEALPSEGENSTIYLVLNEEGEENNIYNEYLYLNKKWELIGTTKIDLSDYVTIENLQAKDYATNKSVNAKLANYSTTAVADGKYAEKSLYGVTTINVGRKTGTTVGEKSVAEGNNVTANGRYTHAEGNETIANDQSAHAEGQQTIAWGPASHTEGDNTRANGQAGHAEGYHTISEFMSQHVQGEYNIADPGSGTDVRGTYAHIVGNGSGDIFRSNAHTLDWRGNAWFSGDVYVKSTSGVNKDEGSKKLATVDEIPAVPTSVSQLTNDSGFMAMDNNTPIQITKIWTGTQEQYEALAAIDQNTIYNIIEE